MGKEKRIRRVCFLCIIIFKKLFSQPAGFNRDTLKGSNEKERDNEDDGTRFCR